MPESESQPAAGPLRVLVVEDDDFTRVTLKAAIERFGLEVVATAADAKTAVVRAVDARAQVGVFDLDLGPGPTGLDVAQLDTRDRPADFAESLAAVGSPWEGLIDVHVAVTPEVVISNMTEQGRRLVERIVEEALTNAYRHGGASRVDVHVDGRDGRLIVRVTDNGCGPQGSLQPGLGCRLFETAATDSWSLRSGSHGGAELEIVLG